MRKMDLGSKCWYDLHSLINLWPSCRLASGEYDYDAGIGKGDSHNATKREYNIAALTTKSQESEDGDEEEIEEEDHNYVSSGDLEADQAAREQHLQEEEASEALEQEM